MAQSPQTESLSSGQRWYREVYLRSDHWRVLRKLKFEYSSGRCHVCRTGRHLDVHHTAYGNLFHERLGQLVILCRDCHGSLHRSKSSAEARATDTALNLLSLMHARDLKRVSKAPKRHRKSEGFRSYAYHCLRAFRHGLATREEHKFIQANRDAIRRLPI